MEVLFKQGDRLVVAAVGRVEMEIIPHGVNLEVTLYDGSKLEATPVRFDGEQTAGMLNHMLGPDAALEAMELVARASEDEAGLKQVARIRKLVEISKRVKSGEISEKQGLAEVAKIDGGNPVDSFLNSLNLDEEL